MSANTASMTHTLALLDRLKTQMPELWGQAQVVGKWVWLEFTCPPLRNIRSQLKELGFHWNGPRKCWQHPCGIPRPRRSGDPRSYYEVKPASELEVKDAPPAEQVAVALNLTQAPTPGTACSSPSSPCPP